MVFENVINWLFKGSSETKPCPASLQEKDYPRLADEALQKAVSILESDGWKKEKADGDDIIYSKVIPVYGKVFKFVVSITILTFSITDFTK